MWMRLISAATLTASIATAFFIIGGKKPHHLGVKNGILAPCPDWPNCVSTQTEGGYPQAQPIPYDGNTAAARARILQIINAASRTRIITERDNYIHAEYRSRFFRLVDDVEFYFDEARSEIHFRSASRIGFGDLNANPRRMAAIRAAFTQT